MRLSSQKFVASLICCLIAFTNANAALPDKSTGKQLLITKIFVVKGNPTTLMITGENFDAGKGALVVTIGEEGELNIISDNATEILVELPPIPDGDYLLSVFRDEEKDKGDKYGLTIGAEVSVELCRLYSTLQVSPAPSFCAAPAACAADETHDCSGQCYPVFSLGDGVCDAQLDCDAWAYDLGDCLFGCANIGAIEDCSGQCYSADSLGDGYCDAQYDCPALGYDEGDCAAPPACAAGEIEDCSGQCYSVESLGDGVCDAQFNCPALGYDAADCQAP